MTVALWTGVYTMSWLRTGSAASRMAKTEANMVAVSEKRTSTLRGQGWRPWVTMGRG